jgi:hypothetical protein
VHNTTDIVFNKITRLIIFSFSEVNCIDINVVTKRWGYENSWTFGACSSTQKYPNSATTKEQCCQPAGEYELVCKCSCGDGWHRGYLEIDGQKYCKKFRNGYEKTESATMCNSASGMTHFCFHYPLF